MSRHVTRHTFRWYAPSPPCHPPFRVMVARPAEVTQVQITLTQHDTAGAPCDTTHPMWRHRGTAEPEPPPPPRRSWVSSDVFFTCLVCMGDHGECARMRANFLGSYTTDICGYPRALMPRI